MEMQSVYDYLLYFEKIELFKTVKRAAIFLLRDLKNDISLLYLPFLTSKNEMQSLYDYLLYKLRTLWL